MNLRSTGPTSAFRVLCGALALPLGSTTVLAQPGPPIDQNKQLLDPYLGWILHYNDPNVNGFHDPGEAYYTTPKMHFAQWPDETGWDINATDPLVLADDWTCTRTQAVTQITFWGSWYGGLGEIGSFLVRIHEDIPENPPDVPYSRPGAVVWTREFQFALVTATHIPAREPPVWEGWYDPSIPHWNHPDHDNYWRYTIDKIATPFVQQEGTVYWLSITALDVTGGEWGWKTADVSQYPAPDTGEHYLDDAVWRDGAGEWQELSDPRFPPPPDPTAVSLDLAFVIGPWRPDNSCWMASAANMLAYEGYGNSYLADLAAGGAASPNVDPWANPVAADGGGGLMTFDDGGYAHWRFAHGGVQYQGPIVTTVKFGLGSWAINPVTWCQNRLAEDHACGLGIWAVWADGRMDPDMHPGRVDFSQGSAYHAITLWEINVGAGTVKITDSDDELAVPVVSGYTWAGNDWILPNLYGAGLDWHVNYAVALPNPHKIVDDGAGCPQWENQNVYRRAQAVHNGATYEVGVYFKDAAGDLMDPPGVYTMDPGEKKAIPIPAGAVRICVTKIAGARCDDDCKDVSDIIPAVSEWGLIVMVLVGLTAGTIMFGRRRWAATV